MTDSLTPEGWSVADPRGIQTRVLDRNHRHRLRRSTQPPQPEALVGLPSQWRGLLTEWLKGPTVRRSWKSLLKIAGNTRYVLANDLKEALVEAGWGQLDERRKLDRWEPHHLDWLAADNLREALGLERLDARNALRQDALARSPADERLRALHESLRDLATASLARRASIVHALDRWVAERRTGTRQQFALHACGDTKALSAGDWRWLSGHVDLEELGISRHSPTLWLRAPLRLYRGGDVLDLRLVPDLIGLSPLTLSCTEAVSGHIDAWLLLENRTSFELVARQAGARQAVVWMPGFAPDWWLQAMDHLLRQLPKPAWIAADPDPAGIEIARRAGALWQSHGLNWHAWSMDDQSLDELRQHKPLNRYDRERLAALSLQTLPLDLRSLADAMAQQGIKGEQEGLDLLARLPLPFNDPT